MKDVSEALPFLQGGVEGVISYPHQMLKKASGALQYGHQPFTAARSFQGCSEQPEGLC